MIYDIDIRLFCCALITLCSKLYLVYTFLLLASFFFCVFYALRHSSFGPFYSFYFSLSFFLSFLSCFLYLYYLFTFFLTTTILLSARDGKHTPAWTVHTRATDKYNGGLYTRDQWAQKRGAVDKNSFYRLEFSCISCIGWIV